MEKYGSPACQPFFLWLGITGGCGWDYAILMAYLFGLLIERYQSVPKLARLFLALSVSSSLLMLGYFKYADFFIRNVNAATISVAILWS